MFSATSATSLSWSRFTASVPSVPAATSVICRPPTATLLSRVATESAPSATLSSPIAAALLPSAVLLKPSAQAPPPIAVA
ncbi:hypothetical protein N791_12650 [Lysobacter defluvii IMMIB APB-9 = DSM 18482]|uniref:Uncharacterized protein n=1 Tax=Lysobacter defluvii IMMIB APB-9 = DSM 18482 TaxID=1385515 RepID=A0A0A0M7Q5_9GAMM|nr:hypothetical protein N791_12650 [Lysobacter defluvii IMMIB APB-9 = DSM 18482]